MTSQERVKKVYPLAICVGHPGAGYYVHDTLEGKMLGWGRTKVTSWANAWLCIKQAKQKETNK